MDCFLHGPPHAPPMTLEVGYLLKMGDRADAEPRDRSNVFGNAEKLLKERLTIERDPADAVALGGRGEPEVLYGEARGVKACVGYCMAAEHVGCSPRRVISHDD